MATIQQSIEFPGCTTEELYATYVDPKRHAEAVGGRVEMSENVGAEFSVFGQVRGKNLLVMAPKLLVQTWRAMPWQSHDRDSILVLAFSPSGRGARIDLLQLDVPEAALAVIDEGWHTRYWQPWKTHFAKRK